MAYILSLEIGGTDLRTLVANMTEPARLLSEGRPTIELSRGVQYVVHETDAERAAEISGEFYPSAEAAAEPSTDQSEKEEQLARICELAHQLGLNDAQTKMLIGKSVGNLAALERKLLNELDERPARTLTGNGENGQRRQPEQKTGQTSGATPTSRPASATAEGEVSAGEGFLF